MYKSYFGFDEAPFSITPDPKFIYMSQRHKDALAHLKYGLFETNGFVLLTGEVGTGKTALCRCLLEQLPKTVDIAFILNPKQTALELVANICDELHISYPESTASIKTLIDLLNEKLLENHSRKRRTILIIDEAQNLSDEVLEQIRLLTNLETSKRKLLQILLVGQPELQEMLARPVMRQLTQRITARYHIAPLSQVETAAYIRHRMWVAGVQRPIFSNPAINKIYRLCNGTPRLINIICDRALLGAYANNTDTINVKIVTQAASEILPNTQGRLFSTTRKTIAASIVAASFAVAAYTLPQWNRQDDKPAEKKPAKVLSAPAATDHSAPPPARSIVQAIPPSAPPLSVAVNETPAARPDTPLLDHGRGTPLVMATTLTHSGQPAHTDKAAPVTLQTLLDNEACNSGTETAVRDLFHLWGISYSPRQGHSACETANGAGLRCIQGKGTWNNLRRYNRPAIIELQGDNGNWQHLLIEAMGAEQIVLRCGEKRAQIALAEADSHWFGDYLLFWKPPKTRLRFAYGDRGRDVQQFRQQIKTALGIEDYSNNDFFDERLEAQVMEFQRMHALKADGIAGKDTIILLNTLTNQPGIPLLASVKE